jgi:hypothetical protein
MKCQVTGPRVFVALQGQFLAGTYRVMGRTRGGLRSGVAADANPCVLIASNGGRRLRCEAKNWPYRPEGAFVPVSRDCIPGWWTWPYRPQSHGWRRVCKTCASTLFADEGAIAVRGRECFRPLRLPVLVHLRPGCVFGL